MALAGRYRADRRHTCAGLAGSGAVFTAAEISAPADLGPFGAAALELLLSTSIARIWQVSIGAWRASAFSDASSVGHLCANPTDVAADAMNRAFARNGREMSRNDVASGEFHELPPRRMPAGVGREVPAARFRDCRASLIASTRADRYL